MTKTNALIATVCALGLNLGACVVEESHDGPLTGNIEKPRDTSNDEGTSENDGEDCFDRYCDDELNDCGNGCQELLGCMMNCETDACLEQCFSYTTEESAYQVFDLLDCYEGYCSDDSDRENSPSETTSQSSEPTSSVSTDEINLCIAGVGNFCGCAAAADAPCSETEIDNYYNACFYGDEWENFDAYLCMGDSTPSSLNSCLNMFDSCID